MSSTHGPGADAFASPSSSSPNSQPRAPPPDIVLDDGSTPDAPNAQGLISDDLREPLSFKRKQARPTTPSSSNLLSSSARFISSLASPDAGAAAPRPSTPTSSSSPRRRPNPGHSRQHSSNGFLFSPSRRPGSARPYSAASSSADPRGASSSKDAVPPLDWYAEGPGRRVGYEDLTAIDWIFEYTKERTRLRGLAGTAGGGALGKLRLLLDSGQVWVILVLTGLLVGLVAAAIDVTTDWLGDLKVGYCAGGPEGGHFYLSKGFCCYGYDQGSHCAGWHTWGEVLGLGNSPFGRWAVGYIFFIVFGVGLACCSALLVQDYSIHAKHSGIPEIKTILGGFVIRSLLGTWTLVTKSFGLCLSVASGMWLGKEGPLVHVACCCANLFIKLFGNINENEARKREVLSAAAASGISVAFGSPIGGVLFSLEQLAYYFPDKTMWQSFVCAMTAAVTLQALDPFRSGKLVLFQVKYSTNWNGFEMIPYALLGLLGGLYGGLFIKANMFVAQWKKSRSWLPGPITQVLAVALLTAVVNYPNSYMKIQASEAVSNLFAECSQVLDDQLGLCSTGAASLRTIVLLVFASVLGILLSSITFGLQIPAGIILPSMAVGALTGRAVGIIMELWVGQFPGFFLFDSCEPEVPCINPGTYAVIGAAAALGGVTRMTVSIVVIMFELTGALSYVLPIMIAVMISKWVGDAFSRRGIYEAWIHFNEYPFIDNSDETAPLLLEPDAPTASELMSRIEDLVVLTATGHTVASLTNILETHPYRGFPVISDPRDAILLGYISRAELAYNIANATAPPRSLPPETEAFFSHQPLADPRTTLDLRPWMDQTPLTLPSRASLHLALSYFQKLGLRYILFCDRGVLQGLLTRKDVWYALNHNADASRRDAGLGMGASGLGGPDDVSDEDDDARGLLDDEDDDDGGDGHAGGTLRASVL